MKREIVTAAPEIATEARVATTLRAAAFCREILVLDQGLDPEIRSAGLSRLDFDMLLDLYVAEHERRSRCLWDVCQAASAPLSTAYRHLSTMLDQGLVVRVTPSGDWRRVTVKPSSKAKLWLEEVAARFEEHRTGSSRTSLMGRRKTSYKIKVHLKG